MDPNTNRGPEEYGEQDAPATTPAPAHGGPGAAPGGPVRTVRLVSGPYLLTVNPVDGSEIEPCPPGEQPAVPGKYGPEERAELSRAAAPPAVPVAAGRPAALLERAEETDRLVRLLSRGRSVRVTGPSGAGRTRLLDAVATACDGVAPDGVVRLSGYRRTPTDVMYELFAAVHRAPLHRPDRGELLRLLGEIGAIVVLDDLEFGGAALDELLGATPECAFLLAATPDVAAPSPGSHLEEVFLGGISRDACRELLEGAVGRPLTDEEAAWAADLWFESEGLPLRFVQAGALLRHRARDGEGGSDAYGEPSDDAPAGEDTPLPTVAEAASPAPLIAARLSEAARETLRFAVALGGELPHQAHLPALAQDAHADAALGDLLGCGLITPAGAHYRLAATVQEQLTAAGYADGAGERALTAAQHYAWWAGHPSVTPERAAAESDAILAAMGVLTGSRDGGHPSAAVLLARTAAPAFAAALHWSAWERSLRHGAEAARIAGEVAEEAYFHHELGVLALCTGNLDRARAELEASIGLRGVLSDRRGTVAGRRALALVADRSGTFTPPAGAATPAGEEIPDARTEESVSPPGGVPAGLAAAPAVDATAPTVVTRSAAAGTGTGRGPAKGRRALVLGARRNLVAAGAGALLVAVLGTVVTLGAVSGSDGGTGDKVTTEQSAEPGQSDSGLPADQPDSSSTRTGQGSRPGTGTGTRSGSTAPGAPGTSGRPSGGATAPSTGATDPTTGGPTGGSTRPTDPSTRPTDGSTRPTDPGTTGKPTGKPTPTDKPTATSKPTPTDKPTSQEPTGTSGSSGTGGGSASATTAGGGGGTAGGTGGGTTGGTTGGTDNG